MEKFGYSSLDVLGTGTFATVLKCSDRNGSVCCIKKIEIIPSASAAWFRQVEQEIYLLKNLNHPRIIKFEDYFKTPTDVCIVMEYAEGGSLSKYLTEKRSRNSYLDQYDVIRLFIDVLQGIEYLHMKNVVHKDIKSENLLISADGHLKLADFGVSKIMSGETVEMKNLLMTMPFKPKEAAGTPFYMAPETLKNNFFSFASDVWALGCILYELCTLRSPFHFAKTMDELMQCTKIPVYLPIGSYPHGENPYHPKLISLCESMLTPDPAKRATIRDVITNDVIVLRYYRSYFAFGPRFNYSADIFTKYTDNNNNNDKGYKYFE